MISLRFGDLGLELNPAVGGSIASFSHRDTPILRAARAGSTNPLDQAAYPMIPFSGRIANGTFTFETTDVVLPANMPPELHAIHGQGWQSVWQVKSHSEHAATITLNHPASDWPWHYHARQTFELSESRLTIEMQLQNLSAEPMPAGLGWHPFFPKNAAHLSADVELIWPSDNDTISQPPTHSPVIEQLRKGVALNALALDNAFSTHSTNARLHWPTQARTVHLQASDELGYLIVYTPTNENFFCVEPVSHTPNCLNSTLPASVTGARTLASKQSMTALITLSLV